MIYKHSDAFNIWPYPCKKIDYDAPVEKWEYEKNNMEEISTQLVGRNLWTQTSFTKEDVELLKDILLEVFSRRLPHTFSKLVDILYLQDPNFAHSALIEAARQGQQNLLKHTLPVASANNCISEMIVSSLVGNHISTAVWLVEQSGQKFGMSQTDLYDLSKKSQIQRQKILNICLQHGDVDHIFNNIENLKFDGVKSKLMGDWNAAKEMYLQNQREKPLAVRMTRKM